MTVRVEFFGIARLRAGVSHTAVAAGPEGVTLAELLAELSERFPGLAEDCLDGRRLRPPYVANLDGQRFVADPQLRLLDGQSLLILAADAGG